MNDLRVFREQDLVRARRLIRQWAGITIEGAHDGRMQRCLRDRMSILGFEELGRYLDALAASGPEGDLRTLVDQVTNKETSFFRSPAQFDWIRTTFLPSVQDSDDPLRIWSSAVSTGQEAISLAILLAEAKKSGFHRPVEICASDISHAALHQAALGAVSDRDGEKLTQSQKLQYFERLASGMRVRWDQLPPIRFFHHNLLRPSPVSRMDVVLARNVLIYFDDDDRRRAADYVTKSLRSPGLLVVSPSEGDLHLPPDFQFITGGIFASGEWGERFSGGRR